RNAGDKMAPMDVPGVLDQKAVVDAACRLAERVGAKTLTMRMLADELGVSAMAAYRHVPSKKALLILIADSVMSRVEVPPPGAGTWDMRLELLERAAFAELAKLADLWDLVPFDTVYPNRERLVNAVVGILLEAGFDQKTAALAHETFFGYVVGQQKMGGLLTSSHLRRGHRPQRPESGSLHLGDVEVGGREEWISVEEYFDFGLRVLLNGLRQELGRTEQRGREARAAAARPVRPGLEAPT
ncbi:MAG TPA: TetR family transcriptional regulator, partial [Acidimicrobiales bacterium]|nr:TetR family transcriptional regulator [Acidimicrobiales bacterium]